MTTKELRNLAYINSAMDISEFGEIEMQMFVRVFKPELVAFSRDPYSGKINGILVEDNCGLLSAVIGGKPALLYLGKVVLGEEELSDGIQGCRTVW